MSAGVPAVRTIADPEELLRMIARRGAYLAGDLYEAHAILSLAESMLKDGMNESGGLTNAEATHLYFAVKVACEKLYAATGSVADVNHPFPLSESERAVLGEFWASENAE